MRIFGRMWVRLALTAWLGVAGGLFAWSLWGGPPGIQDGDQVAAGATTMDDKLASFRQANFPDGRIDVCVRNYVAPQSRSAAFAAAVRDAPGLPVAKAFGLDSLDWRFDDLCTATPPVDPLTGERSGVTVIAEKGTYDAYVYVISQDAADKRGDTWPSRLSTQEVYQSSYDSRSPATMAVFIGEREFADARIALHLLARSLGLAGALQDGRLGLDNACSTPADKDACGRDYLTVE